MKARPRLLAADDIEKDGVEAAQLGQMPATGRALRTPPRVIAAF